MLSEEKQEGPDGPGSLSKIFERTIAKCFLVVSEKKNFKEFLYVYKVQVAPVHQSIFTHGSKFH